jgi:hypothetical protein
MFVQGDRVQLISDFNNEPGTLEAGVKGTVQFHNVQKDLVFVTWDDVSSLTDDQQIINDLGLAMYPEEIEAL